MGGLPCRKIIIDGNGLVILNALIQELQTTERLLASKQYADSPVLTEISDYTYKCTDQWEDQFEELKSLNKKYSEEE